MRQDERWRQNTVISNMLTLTAATLCLLCESQITRTQRSQTQGQISWVGAELSQHPASSPGQEQVPGKSWKDRTSTYNTPHLSSSLQLRSFLLARPASFILGRMWISPIQILIFAFPLSSPKKSCFIFFRKSDTSSPRVC